MLRIAISLIVLVAMVCAVFFIVYGGLMLVLSGGNDDKVSSALGSIRYAVIGLVVIVVAIFVTPHIFSHAWSRFSGLFVASEHYLYDSNTF